MNQLMIELYTQAQKFAYKNISEEYWNTDNFHAIVSGKFAQLIVRECAGIVEDAVDHREPASTYVGKIKEHFGVEE